MVLPGKGIYRLPPDWCHVEGIWFLDEGDDFNVEVVGEYWRQDPYHLLIGERYEDGVDIEIAAELRPEPYNEHDEYAVAVHLDGHKAGYLRSGSDEQGLLHVLADLHAPLVAKAKITDGRAVMGPQGTYQLWLSVAGEVGVRRWDARRGEFCRSIDSEDAPDAANEQIRPWEIVIGTVILSVLIVGILVAIR
ncbi:hypothetical protein ACFQ1E_17315 [Sphingomonas canadensis]|uniref:HIRAN domain-containing protein n=1 Tax=Sphingomonas canadensis TaxID=1219257 RepID=A0ABW3H9H7_9SPHN|nr:hypothetical protein [Sphingomonas canadensis]MCW3837807.1 hypothetical protein [Sphingomonas canadensis]